MAALQPGALLRDRYLIQETLGQGGFGVVYKAVDKSLDVLCAIKENLNLSAQSERQFRREAELLASLRHRYLPRVTNHFLLDNKQYLVMDFVEGEDLRQRLERSGPLPEADVLRWLAQVGDALTYLHGLPVPVIHRDIKPGNIKITPAGDAILVDFGIAKVGASGERTATGALGLTPGFAPPEQYNSGGTDARTDLYALGATYYNLLTNQLPPDSLQRLLQEKKLLEPRQVRPGISPHVSAAIVKAMEPNAAQRFASVRDFQAALANPDFRYTPAKTSTARGARTRSQPGRRGGPRWPLALAAGCALTLVAGVAAVLILAGTGVISVTGLSGVMTRLAPTVRASATPPATAVAAVPTAAATAAPPPTSSPAASPTASPVPSPTARPVPQPISPANASGWRLYTEWKPAGITTKLVLSPDGQQVAFLNNTTVILCKLVSGQCDTPPALAGAFPSPDFLAVAFYQDALLLQRQQEVIEVNPADGGVLGRFPQTGQDFTLSPGRRFFVVRDQRLNVYDTAGCLAKRCHLLMSVGLTDQKYAFSPDDSLVAVASDAYVDLWSTDKRVLVNRLFGHGEPIGDLAFTPDSRSLVAASGDIWDLTTLKSSGYFDSATAGVALTIDGQVIAGRDGDVWELKTGQRLGSLPPGDGDVVQEFFTPDGMFLARRLATGAVQLWVADASAAPAPAPTPAPAPAIGEPITGLNISRLAPYAGFAALSADGLSLSADQKQMATWLGNVVQIVDLPSRTSTAQLTVDGTVASASFLGQGFLLVATSQGTVERWDVARQKLMQRYELGAGEVVGSARGDLFAVSADTVLVVETRTGKVKYKLAKPNGPGSFLFTPDTARLLIANGPSVLTWNMETGKQESRQYIGHSRATQALSITPDGVWLAAGSGDVWKLDSGERVTGLDMNASAAALTPDGQLLFGGDGSVWEVAASQFLGRMAWSAGRLAVLPDATGLITLQSRSVSLYGIQALAIHTPVTRPSGQSALSLEDLTPKSLPGLRLIGWWGADNLLPTLSASSAAGFAARAYGPGLAGSLAVAPGGAAVTVLEADGLSLFDPANGDQVDQFHIFFNPETIQEFAYLGRDALLLKAGAGLERWDLAKGILVRRYPIYGSKLAASPDGRYFALQEGPAYATIFDAASGQAIQKVRARDGQREYTFSPDGNWLAVNTGQVVELRALPAGNVVQTLRGHSGRLTNLQFTADGRRLVAGSGDVWDVATGKRIAEFPAAFDTYALSPSADLLAGSDGSFWDLNTGHRLGTNADLRDLPVQMVFAGQGRLLVGRTARLEAFVWGVPAAAPAGAAAAGAKVITPANASTLQLSAFLNRGRLEDALWAPDSRHLAVNTTQNVIIYETAGLKRVFSFLDSRALAFNPQGQLLLGDGASLRLVDPLTGAVVKSYEIAGVTKASFSQDGQQIAIGQVVNAATGREAVAVVDAASGQTTQVEQGLYAGLEDIRFLPGTGWLMASFNGVIAFWSSQAGAWTQARPLLHGNTGPADLSPDGTLVAYFTANNRISIQQVARGFEVRSIGTELIPTGLLLPYYVPFDFDFLSADKLIVFYRQTARSSGHETLAAKIWDLTGGSYADTSVPGQPLSDLSGQFTDFYSLHNAYKFPAVVMSPDRTKLYTVTSDGVLRLWSYPDGAALGATDTDYLPLMAVSPAGDKVAVLDAFYQIDVLSTATGELVQAAPRNWQPAAMEFLNQNLLAVLEKNGLMSLVALDKSQTLETRDLADAFDLGRADFSLGGRLLAAWSQVAARNRVNIFALSESGTPLLTLEGFPRPDSLVISPDGMRLAIARDEAVQWWDLQTDTLLFELKGRHRDFGNLVITPDGSRLIAATGEVWALDNGNLVGAFASTTHHIVLSPDGRLIVGDEGTMWDAGSLQPVEQMRGLRAPAVNLAFTADGQALIWQNQAGFIEVWRLP